MPNFMRVLQGIVAFALAYFFLAITDRIFPILFPMINDATLESILWFGAILLWVLVILVVPAGLFIIGLKEGLKDDSQIFGSAFGIIYMICAFAILYFTWSWNTTLVGVFNTAFLSALYWVGILVFWVFQIGVIPIYYIISSKQN